MTLFKRCLMLAALVLGTELSGSAQCSGGVPQGEGNCTIADFTSCEPTGCSGNTYQSTQYVLWECSGCLCGCPVCGCQYA